MTKFVWGLVALWCVTGWGFISSAQEVKPDNQELKLETEEAKYETGKLMQRRTFYRDAEGQKVDHGRYYYWFPNGNMSQDTQYKHGKRDGKQIVYHFSGGKESEQFWVDGKQEGKEQWWDENGVLYRVCEYKNDMPDGVWTWYYPPTKATENIKVSEQHWKEGLKNGPWKWWYANGQLGISGQYQDHRQHGTWKYFDEAGKQTEVREYRDGELVVKAP